MRALLLMLGRCEWPRVTSARPPGVTTDHDSDSFCSGEDSVEEAPESGPIMVVEVTRGLKAENGDCQFMVGSVFLSSHLTLVVTQGIGQELANGSSELLCSDQSEATVCLYLTLFLAAQVRTMETMTVRKCQTIRHRHDPTWCNYLWARNSLITAALSVMQSNRCSQYCLSLVSAMPVLSPRWPESYCWLLECGCWWQSELDGTVGTVTGAASASHPAHTAADCLCPAPAEYCVGASCSVPRTRTASHTCGHGGETGPGDRQNIGHSLTWHSERLNRLTQQSYNTFGTWNAH